MSTLTPAYKTVQVQLDVFGRKSFYHQNIEVETLDEHPEKLCSSEIGKKNVQEADYSRYRLKERRAQLAKTTTQSAECQKCADKRVSTLNLSIS